MEHRSAARHARRGSWWELVFRVSLVLKGLDGVLEIIGGVLFAVMSPERLNSLVRILTQHELAEDPGDLVANALLHASGGLTQSTTWFAAGYLLLHGLVKVVLVWAVLAEKLWAYPWMIAFLLVFIGYQAYQLTLSFGPWLFLLTLFDLFITWLTVREYRILRARRRQRLA